HIYAKAFGKGPVVFGAIPSLHAATAVCCCLFVIRYCKHYRGLIFTAIYGGIMFWSTQYFHHHFAIDLLLGTFYSAVSFLIFERVRLRKLDRHHYANGLTNGYDRLFHCRHDGEHFTSYGERQLALLTGDAGASEADKYDAGRLSRSTSGGSVRMANLASSAAGAGAGAKRAGGYEAVPQRGASEDLDPRADGGVVFELRGEAESDSDSDGEGDEKAQGGSRTGSPRVGLGAVRKTAVV
ncbi:hypothetical protein JCM10207_004278, partial [Rhodosporidiobolus poonsookiae]